jgi:hypothetical protein
MNQIEKMISNREVQIDHIVLANVTMAARAEFCQFYQNLCVSLEKRFDIALLRWRCGDSPVADMKAALSVSGEMVTAIRAWRLDDETINGYGDVWSLVRYIAFLLDQPLELPDERLLRIRESRSQYADVALEYHILDALDGREWHEGVAELLERLATNKRQALAVETYRTYFALLEADGDNEQVHFLVRAAEVNYRKRTRDAFYGGGPTYMGGGPDNPYVIDFGLAAILKRIGWTGDTVHKWMWDTQ